MGLRSDAWVSLAVEETERTARIGPEGSAATGKTEVPVGLETGKESKV